MMTAIDASRLTVTLGEKTILNQVSFRVEKGTTAAIVGRPGSGKSILLRALLGQAAIVQGNLQVCGWDPRPAAPEVRRRVTYVASPSVFEHHLTTRQNVTHILRLAGAADPSRDAVDRALRDSDVPDRDFDRLAAQLDQRAALLVWLAIARLRSSELVMLDDPAAYLTASQASQVASVARELAEVGPAVLLVTRDDRWAGMAAGPVYSLEDGHLSLPIRARPPHTDLRMSARS